MVQYAEETSLYELFRYISESSYSKFIFRLILFSQNKITLHFRHYFFVITFCLFQSSVMCLMCDLYETLK